ncbi:MAG: hypothetical protein AAGL97_04065 [Pseudomonadota bacterium]
MAQEPELDHTKKRPDFIVAAADGTGYFLEATARKADDDFLANVKNGIDAIDSPVYLDVSIKDQPTQTLSVRKMTQRIAAFIAEVVVYPTEVVRRLCQSGGFSHLIVCLL